MSLSETVSDGTTCALVDYASIQEDPLIRQAIGVLEERLFRRGASLTSPTAVREYLRLKLASEALEVFAVVFLDAQHCVIAYEQMFRGTIDGAAVYPRAVVKRAIEHNCAAVILAHCHPSGSTEPSQADKAITTRLKSALELVDVRVLDHFIIGEGVPFSFAEVGLL
ncbi:RadC family protein [Alloalcanivorax xenomutans]|jgi:DNA repair protein RadC|uniref:DNA repair protein RadC n=1 Tax=Alloalcanivorax xenomutans TaxID=1094342 RepID=A0A9Q3W7X3_9GAMM|nr:DNA repair protein RadC [Alloalcanivorax xenomutans]MBA4721460.1 DNA repair protein RadC [Alcanivorax sp.]MCE7509708.1 DNA repair protein RadC [Alloalcanivorax xenomutans]CUR45098.1 DNA repair protein RadC [Alloalcanivorax xenomutans]|tara:strand:- start:17185 stop:17685 length:501 start_codon:yes stop_codon:yes gene_type:complete